MHTSSAAALLASAGVACAVLWAHRRRRAAAQPGCGPCADSQRGAEATAAAAAAPMRCPCVNCTCGPDCKCAPGAPGCDPCSEFQRAQKPNPATAAPVISSADELARSAPPAWWREAAAAAVQPGSSAKLLRINEWERGSEWRKANGWVGTDLIHGSDAAVHCAGYLLDTTAEGRPRLVGAVHFGVGAESHRGLCHGGAMTALMDDVIGWCGFCATGVCVPWCGFTVQIDTSLKAPVKVGSWLRIEASITERTGRKVWLRATLTDPAAVERGIVHCEARGLFLLKSQ